MVWILLSQQLVLWLVDLFQWSFQLPSQSLGQSICIAKPYCNAGKQDFYGCDYGLRVTGAHVQGLCKVKLPSKESQGSSSQYGARHSPSLSAIWNPGILGIMLFIWEITKPLRYFLTTMARGGGHLPRLLWMSLFTHKDGSFSGEHSHPERIQWSLWHCTHINQGQEFCLCLIVCVASLQVLVGVYGWERARNIPLVLPPGVDRHLFYTALGAFYTDVCLSHWTGPKEQLHGVNCNTHTHTYTQCKIAIILVSNALNIPQNTARSITNKMRKCGTHLNFTTMKDATNPQNLNVHEYPQCRQ